MRVQWRYNFTFKVKSNNLSPNDKQLASIIYAKQATKKLQYRGLLAFSELSSLSSAGSKSD
jgi:hypothetical protein